MATPGSASQPLRVAVVGSGPAGFYTVQALFKARELVAQVDMFEALPTPFGLVRYGVAPDHQKIKSVTAVYEKLASQPRFRFFGSVHYGRDLQLADLRRHYHQIVFTTGAQTDRRLGIPGEDLEGSHPATDFVAWYNGHPEFTNLEFDLSQERAVVVGVGNVAVDVARILGRTPEELAATDMADHAIEALARSNVKEICLVGRRGPAQAAFTNPEIKELGEMAGTETSTLAEEVELDAISHEAIADDRAGKRKVEFLKSYAGRREPDKPRKLVIRFLVSPVELLGDAAGRVCGVRLVKNELYRADGGAIRSRATDRFETLPAGLVFRSVGYRGVPLTDLPFREDWGIVPNAKGRVTAAPGGSTLAGLYVAGWIKRGPSGVIGTNKPDAVETVGCMLEDLQADRTLQPTHTDVTSVNAMLESRELDYVTYDDWRRIDHREVERGKPTGRPRVKFTRYEEFREALQA